MKEFKIGIDNDSNKYLVVEVNKEVIPENAIAEGRNKSEAMRDGLANLKQWNKMTNNQEDFIIFFDYDNMKKDGKNNESK